jgi:transposase
MKEEWKDVVRLIKILLKRGNISIRQIASLFNVGKQAVYYIKSGRNWSHIVPYGWEKEKA